MPHERDGSASVFGGRSAALARKTITRRFLQGLTVAGMAAFTTRGVLTQQLMETATTTEGTFYPDKMPLDTDNCRNSWPVAGRRNRSGYTRFVHEALSIRYARFMRDARHGHETLDGVVWPWHEMGEGPLALVVMPGAVGTTDLFFVLYQELHRDLRVIGVDLPFVTDASTAMRQMDEVLARRGVEQAILLGASFSGIFVQVFARHYPSRTRALILSHTGALDPSRAPRQRLNARRAARIPLFILRGLLRVVVGLLLRKLDERRFWMEHYRAVVDAVTKEAMISRYLLEASLEELPGAPWAGDLLVIHSDNDAIAKPEQQRRLREQYPQAQWTEFKRTGHSSYSRDPMAYAAAVGAFLTRVRL